LVALRSGQIDWIEALPPEAVSAAILKGDSLLKALRNWRGSTRVQRAEAVGIGRGFL
jgi:hypothetical protein